MVNFTYTSENLAHRGHSSLLLSAICLRCYSQARGPEKHIPVIRTLWFDLNPLILPQPISRLGNNFFFKLLVKWHSHSKCSKTSILLNKMFLMSDVTECVCVFNINGILVHVLTDKMLPSGFDFVSCLHFTLCSRQRSSCYILIKGWIWKITAVQTSH